MSKIAEVITLVVLAICLMSQARQSSKIDSLVFTKVKFVVLDEERKIVVHLPLNYKNEPGKNNPVMYVLDAGKLDFDISERLYTLSSSSLLPEFIVVGILNNKGKREENLTHPFMQTVTNDSLSPYGKANLFLEFIKSELIPTIDRSYRTNSYRDISGLSRGGLFVLYSLIELPEIFNARFSYSTPAWRFDNLIINKLENSFKRRIHDKKSFLFISVGANENPNILASHQTMQNQLIKIKPKNLEYKS